MAAYRDVSYDSPELFVTPSQTRPDSSMEKMTLSKSWLMFTAPVATNLKDIYGSDEDRTG